MLADPFRPLFPTGYALGLLGLGIWLPAMAGPDFLFLAAAPALALLGSALRIAAGTGLLADSRWDRLGALILYQGCFLLLALGALPDEARAGGGKGIARPGFR